MKNLSRFGRILLVIFFLTAITTAFYHVYVSMGKSQGIQKNDEEKEWLPSTMVFAGDVMVHDSQIRSAYNPLDETYCFSSCFEKIEPLIKSIDIAVINLETTLAGKDQEYTGYPAFNAPESLALSLREAGFDFVSTANNHSLDRGEYGVLKTLEHLKEASLQPFGTYSSWEAREEPLIISINDIAIALMAYTYGTNGIPLPENKEYLVNLLDPLAIIKDIQNVRDKVDMVILYLHWGLEYHREPLSSQREMAIQLFEEGASVIIGNHPHVVQPIERISYQYQGESREGIVAYSLGNFIGDQIEPYTDTGIMLFLKMQKEEEKVEILEVSYVPTYIHRFFQGGKRQFQVLPLLPEEERWEILTDDPFLSLETIEHLKNIQSEMKEHIPQIPQGLLSLAPSS